MSINAATIAPNIDAVAMAIESCCTTLVVENQRMLLEIGGGIASFGNDYLECCKAEIAGNTVTQSAVAPVPGVAAVPAQYGPGGVLITAGVPAVPGIPGIPAYTGPAAAYGAWLENQAFNFATTTQNTNYTNYLDQLASWQNAQTLPVFLALLANLAQTLENLKVYKNMLDCSEEILDGIKAELSALQDLSQFKLIPAVEEHCDALMAKFSSTAALTAICDQRAEITERGTSMWACFENTYKPELTQYFADFTGQMFSHGAAGSEQQIELRDLNREMYACWSELLKAEDMVTEPVLGAAIRDMVEKLEASCAWLSDCAEKLSGHWDTAYAVKDADYSCAAMESATAALEGVQEHRDVLKACRDAWKAIQDSVYHAGEAVHVPELHQAAIDTVGKFDEIAMCAFECAEDEKARYMATYAAKENSLSLLAMGGACDLHPCFMDIKNFLTDNSDDLFACWNDGWKAKEFEYACALLDKALTVMCEQEIELEEFCACLESFKAHWEDCYKQAECQVMPKLILAGQLACEKNELVYTKLCTHMDHLWSKFENTWCPWDEQDAQYFCDLWIKCNPLDELCHNHDCQQDLADVLKSCYTDLILPWEKDYITEICAMDPYVAKYCETEISTMLHVRAQFNKASERAIKATPRHCSGASKQQQIDIMNQRIRAEAAAMATANRDERWWKTQEDDRRHRYTLDVLERLGKRYPEHAIQLYAGSSNILDSILGRMHERLVRGYEYVRNHNDYGRSIFNATSATVDAAQRAVQIGQAYPDQYIRGKSELHRSSEAFQQSAQNMMQLGQFYPTLASQNNERAANIVSQAGSLGFQHMQHGHEHVRTALNAKKVAADTAQSAQDNALRSYAIGQDYLRLALASVAEDSTQTNLLVSAASSAQNTGVEYARLASGKMEAVMQGGLSALREGNALMSNHRLYAGQIASGYESVIGNGLAGFDGFLKAQRLGLETGQMAGKFAEAGLRASMESMSSSCDFLERIHCCTSGFATQGGNGALQQAADLMASASQGTSSGVDGIIGSLAALNTPPSPPSIATGNQFTFGGA